MTLARALQVAAGNSQESADVAEAIDFDGTNDYLQRTSGLVGNTNGKAFTFSVWVWPNRSGSSEDIYNSATGSGGFRIRCNGGTNWSVYAYNSSGTEVLACDFTTPVPSTNTFVSLLVSVDLTSTANRYVYVNDVAASPSWSVYTNANINRTTTTHQIAAWSGGGVYYRGRLSNFFLDYTYRDLSNVTNRRLFVTADLKPAAGQAALNPILYLPMSDPTAPGVNAGTGGNFTLTGTVARSGRGPNQYNAPYSTFDGSADYLERASVAGMADASTFTFACSFIVDVTTNSYIAQCGGNEFAVRVQSGQLRLQCYATGSVLLVSATVDITGGFVVGRNYVVTISVDTTNSGKRHVYINGAAATVTWSTYTSGSIYFAQTWRIGREATTPYFSGKLGALWFNTSYIDLSVPANLAKFVTGTGIDAKPVDVGANGELPTGTSPLIYLPMYGNNAGKNYGTGGDFTVNSGPYTGARGPNEFWANWAVFDGVSTTNLKKTGALTGGTTSSTFSASFLVNFDVVDTTRRSVLAVATNSSTNGVLYMYGYNGGAAPTFYIYARPTPGGAFVLAASFSIAAATTYFIQICVDLTNSAKRAIYVNGTAATVTWSTYTNSTMAFGAAADTYIGSSAWPETIRGKIAELYLTTSYIDFTLEANRLKFRDAFGNPMDLTQQIEDGAIPNPAIYMRFPPTAFGTNSGTGGDFTVNGTITDGGQL